MFPTALIKMNAKNPVIRIPRIASIIFVFAYKLLISFNPYSFTNLSMTLFSS